MTPTQIDSRACARRPSRYLPLLATMLVAVTSAFPGSDVPAAD